MINEESVVIALDPGIARTGWAVLYKRNGKIIPVEYGCIETIPKITKQKRLQVIFNALVKTIKKHQPKIMVIEKVFFNSNQKTAIVVGQAQGVMLLAAAVSNLEVVEVTPLQIKQTLTGYGSAKKDQVERMVIALLELKKAPKLDDTVDAIACGMTYLSMNQLLTNTSI
jgi:crossover junction endodeoxyribonuclease RuvC